MKNNRLEEVYLYGASYLDSIKIIEQFSLFNILGIIDDTQKLKGTDFLQYRVVGGIDYCDNKNLNIINNVFKSSHDRFEVYKKLLKPNIKIKSILPPTINYDYVQIGNGVCINTGVKLGADSVLGDNVAIRYNSVINHGCKIGNHVFIGPGVTLCGNIIIEDFCYIGAGATILPNLKIGSNSIIGAGSVVTKDIRGNQKVYGVPASEM